MARIQLNVSFKNNSRDMSIFNWLMDKGSPSNYIKDLCQREMLQESKGIIFQELSKNDAKYIEPEEYEEI